MADPSSDIKDDSNSASETSEVVAEPEQPSATERKLDAEGRERPRFLLEFPDDPALNELVRAFERGDYAFVRKVAPELAASTSKEHVKTAALELQRRIEPDPLVKYLLAIAVLLLVFLTFYAYHSHD